jgi:hypothetical protein
MRRNQARMQKIILKSSLIQDGGKHVLKNFRKPDAPFVRAVVMMFGASARPAADAAMPPRCPLARAARAG